MGKEKEKKKKFETSPKALFAIPTAFFLALIFLFPVLSESFLKISAEKYKARREEFKSIVKANKKRYEEMKKDEALKYELTISSPTAAQKNSNAKKETGPESESEVQSDEDIDDKLSDIWDTVNNINNTTKIKNFI